MRINVPLAAAVLVLCAFLAPSAPGQSQAQKLPPELIPHSTKFETEMELVNRVRTEAVSVARKPYLDALAAAEQKAATPARADELKAVLVEKEAVLRDQPLDQVASPLLPRDLMRPRSAFLREIARIDRSHSTRAQQPVAAYLRALEFLETKARNARQTDLLQQIEAEKARVSGSSGKSRTPETNLVLNGDFAEKKADGTPDKWNLQGAGKAAVTSEGALPFLRFANGGPAESALAQRVKRPVESRELRISVRLRCPDYDRGDYGIVVNQFDANGTFLHGEDVCISNMRLRSWKEFERIVKLRPQTAEAAIRCTIRNSPIIADFAALQVFAH